jgi:hypothetical protein
MQRQDLFLAIAARAAQSPCNKLALRDPNRRCNGTLASAVVRAQLPGLLVEPCRHLNRWARAMVHRWRIAITIANFLCLNKIDAMLRPGLGP